MAESEDIETKKYVYGERRCFLCDKKATFNCPDCHVHFYCDTNCQKEHWFIHKDKCEKQSEEVARKAEYNHFVKVLKTCIVSPTNTTS